MEDTSELYNAEVKIDHMKKAYDQVQASEISVNKFNMFSCEPSHLLKSSKNPSKLIIDMIQESFPDNAYETYEEFGDKFWISYISYLNQLMSLSRPIDTHAKEAAKNVADGWKRRLVDDDISSNWEIVCFLHLVYTYDLIDSFDRVSVSSITKIVSQLKNIPKSCWDINFIGKMTELIQKLVDKDLHVDAIRLVYTFGLEDKFPPSQLLKKFLEISQNSLSENPRKIKKSSETQAETSERKIVALRAIIGCIDEHKIEFEIPMSELEQRIIHIKKENDISLLGTTPNPEKPTLHEPRLVVKKNPQGETLPTPHQRTQEQHHNLSMNYPTYVPRPTLQRPHPKGRPTLQEPRPMEKPTFPGYYHMGKPTLQGPHPMQRPTLQGPHPMERPIFSGNYPKGRPPWQGPHLVKRPTFPDNYPMGRPTLQGPHPTERPTFLDNNLMGRPTLQGHHPMERPAFLDNNPMGRPTLQGHHPMERPAFLDNNPMGRPTLQGHHPMERPAFLGNNPMGRPTLQGHHPMERPTLQGHHPMERPAFPDNYPMRRPTLQGPRPWENPTFPGYYPRDMGMRPR